MNSPSVVFESNMLPNPQVSMKEDSWHLRTTTIPAEVRHRKNQLKQYISEAFPFIKNLEYPWREVELKLWSQFLWSLLTLGKRMVKEKSAHWQRLLSVDEISQVFIFHSQDHFFAYHCNWWSETIFCFVPKMGKKLMKL